MTDYDVEHIEPWVSSLCNTGFTGQKVMLTYNLRPSVRDLLKSLDFEIWSVGKPNMDNDPRFSLYYKPIQQFNICVERFYHTAKFLEMKKDYENVILTDVKDVVFQENPIVYMNKIFENDLSYDCQKSIIVTSENMKYKDEIWAKNNMEKSFPGYADKMMNREIFNAGIVSGRWQHFVDFLHNVYLLSLATGLNYVDGGGGPDQAAMNLALSMEIYKDHVSFISHGRPFACQAGTTADPSKIGEYQEFMIDPMPPIFNEGIRNYTNQLYAMVHQYDRVPEWNKYFKDKYTYKSIIEKVKI